jgi:hypothetical protein
MVGSQSGAGGKSVCGKPLKVQGISLHLIHLEALTITSRLIKSNDLRLKNRGGFFSERVFRRVHSWPPSAMDWNKQEQKAHGKGRFPLSAEL